ncbi:MAG TPA: alpha/beta hydrolase-fold protein [Polyangiaceae bacterium]
MKRGVFAVLVVAGCRGGSPPSTAPAEPAAAVSTAVDATPDVDAADGGPGDASSSSSSVPPLAGFFESLAVAGHPDAFVSLPTGATGRRPVVVVIHGAGDRPDWQCGGWRRATGERAFVVCPTGKYAPGDSTKTDRRYTHAGGPELSAYIDGALEALAARYPQYVDAERPLLAGFSLGSYAILAIAVAHPDRFPRIALVEGATSQLDDGRARAFLKAGGRRVLFGCGQKACEMAAKAAAARLARVGLEAHVAYAQVDHTFNPPLEDAVHAELAWWVEGDARWEAGDGG